MNGISRYILKQLTVGIVIVTAALTCVIWLSQSLRFVEMIVNRGLSAGKFIYLTMLLLPNFLSVILPIALFTVILFTYNKLLADREIVVMRAAGMSHWALSRPALMLTSLVVLIGYALNFYFLPVSYKLFRELQWDIRYNYSNILLQEGAFNIVSSGVTVYVRERTSGGDLHSVLVHDARDAEKPTTIMAARGTLLKTGNQARVVMFDGNRQQVDRTTNKLSILYFDRYTFDLESPYQNSLERYREPRERMVSELFNIERDQVLNPKDIGKFLVEGHKRLISPLSALAFALIGLAGLLTGNSERRGQARRISLTVAAIVFLQTASLGLENAAARNLQLLYLMYANAFLPILIAWYFLTRPLKRRRKRKPTGLVGGTT